MNAGDTLYVNNPGLQYDSHLWVIVSDPDIDPRSVLIVNFTSWRADKDQACVVDKSDHPYIRHKTCVNYAGSKVQSVDDLGRLVQAGTVSHREPASEELLRRMRDGAIESKFMMMSYANLLIEQGVVDL